MIAFSQFILYISIIVRFVNAELRLLVIGGETLLPRYGAKMILGDVELIDPFNTDSDCQKPPDLPFPRKCLIAEYLDNHPFIIGGGNVGVMYDTSLVLINNTWIDTPIRLNHLRYCAVSAQPKYQKMWVLGGDVRGTHTGMTSEVLQQFSIEYKKSGQKNTDNSDRQGIDTSNGDNTTVGFIDAMTAPEDLKYSKTSRKCISKINDTHLFIVGYQTGLSYIVDATKLPYTYKALPKMKFGSHNGGACATIQDSLGVIRLFVIGGGTAQLHKMNSSVMRKTEFYDFFLNTWIEGPDLPRMFYMGGFVQYPDERGFILIGGEDLTNAKRQFRYFSDVMRYNQTLNKFEYLPRALNIPRSRFGAMLVETKDDENCTMIVPKITTSLANRSRPDFYNWSIICVIGLCTISRFVGL